LPEFALQSYTGKRVASDDLNGKVVVLTFLESKCTEACPIVASAIARGLELLDSDERDEVAAIAISTQPRDDTTASVRSFLRARRADGKLDYLIGSEADLRPVWKQADILSALDSGDAEVHSAPVRIYDREGEWVVTLHAGADLTRANLAHDIRLVLQS
jgi:cytochrome oxidase Cu insertion factor (SCO1/SenC/PrrC family)